MQKTNHLRIDNPCPFVPTKMNKAGVNYFCKSCSKTIVDFRSKTVDEINSSITPNTCGIFTSDQLPGQQPMKLSRQLLLYCFSFLSVLGFSVRPIAAQTVQTQKDTVLVDAKMNDQGNNVKADKTGVKKTEAKTEEKGLFRRKKKRRLTGCPSF